MTTEEFSNAFDTLINSYAQKAQFGDRDSKRDIVLDEYEKSLFLTEAQEDIVTSLYSGKNESTESFEMSEELRRYLSNLVAEKTLYPIVNISGNPVGMDSNSKFFTLPSELWYITFESVTVDNHKCGVTTMDVIPVRQDEYLKIRKNPFRGANKRRALRFDLSNGVIEIVCKYNVTNYYVRYLKRLSPIILIDLPDKLTINSESSKMTCRLHEALHQRILKRAVLLALQSKGYTLKNDNQ